MDRHLDTILIDPQHGKAKMKYGLMDIGKNSDFFFLITWSLRGRGGGGDGQF